MEKPDIFYAFVCGLVLSAVGSASALPPGADPRLLSLVPPGAAIVAGVSQGTPGSYLALTRNNTADLTDFLSISGVDSHRNIGHATFVAATGSDGFLSEHSLLASGHFDSAHIFKSSLENGATAGEYHGIPVLIVPPLERDKGISDDVRWLAFIDGQMAVFGTVPIVQEELSRYLARSPVDTSLTWELSRLRSIDQSWCVLIPPVNNMEIVRRMLAALDPKSGQPDHANNGLILGIHFGRVVEIEYETVPDSGNSAESHLQTPHRFSPSSSPEAPKPALYFSGNREANLRKVIRLSKERYDKFTEQEETRRLTHGGEPTSLQSKK